MAYDLSKSHQVRSKKPKKNKQFKPIRPKRKQVKTPTPIGPKRCVGCGKEHGLSIHHVYGGSARDFSSQNGAVEWCCWNCHQSSTGIHGTHSDGELDLFLKKKHQLLLEQNGMERSVFIFNVGRNYL